MFPATVIDNASPPDVEPPIVTSCIMLYTYEVVLLSASVMEVSCSAEL